MSKGISKREDSSDGEDMQDEMVIEKKPNFVMSAQDALQLMMSSNIVAKLPTHILNAINKGVRLFPKIGALELSTTFKWKKIKADLEKKVFQFSEPGDKGKLLAFLNFELYEMECAKVKN